MELTRCHSPSWVADSAVISKSIEKAVIGIIRDTFQWRSIIGILEKLTGAAKAIFRLFKKFDDVLAGIIIIALVIAITYSLSSLTIARTDPYNVSLSYFKTVG